MAGSFSDYGETLVLNKIFNGGGTLPTTLYYALYTVAPTESTAGTEVTTGTGYSRQAVTVNTTNFPTTSGNSISNGTDVSFTTATGSWGTVVGMALLDSGTVGAGNILVYATLTTSKAIASGDTAKFTAGDFTFTLD